MAGFHKLCSDLYRHTLCRIGVHRYSLWTRRRDRPTPFTSYLHHGFSYNKCCKDCGINPCGDEMASRPTKEIEAWMAAFLESRKPGQYDIWDDGTFLFSEQKVIDHRYTGVGVDADTYVTRLEFETPAEALAFYIRNSEHLKGIQGL